MPRAQISGLDFDRYQAEHERPSLDLEVKKKASTIAAEAVARRLTDKNASVKLTFLMGEEIASDCCAICIAAAFSYTTISHAPI